MTYQPKTGAPCTCKRGAQRDNCPECEGTGQVIDFRAIRAAKPTTDLYQRVTEAGIPTDSHESDLYVKGTPEAFALVKASGLSWSTFHSYTDGTTWIEIPFAYSPFWERRTGR